MQISPFLWTLLGNIFVAVGILLTILLAGTIKRKALIYIDYLVAVTVGLLIAIVFLGFIPELVASGEILPQTMGMYILLWIGLFYLLELVFHWHHCKDIDDNHCHDHGHNHHHEHEHTNAFLMFTGTFLHNFIHGVEIFVAFSISPVFGMTTTLAILMHAIPQNIANYIMSHKNTLYIFLAAFWGVFGALATYPFESVLVKNSQAIISLIIWGLLYTAMTDIFPSFKEKGSVGNKVMYLVFIIVWVGLFSVTSYFAHHFVG
jgi:zinc and cadmium transporter